MYLLRLRKILLLDRVYIIILLLTSIITFTRLYPEQKSTFTKEMTTIEGRIVDYYVEGDLLQLTVKSSNSKEKIKGNYFFSTLDEKEELLQKSLPGKQVILTGSLKEVLSNITDGLFDYQRYLKNNNIFYLMNIEHIEIIGNENFIYKIKNKIIKRTNESKNSAYLNALFLGDKRHINKKLRKSYQNNGINHLLSISGMHIGLLSMSILVFFKRIKLEEKKRYFIVSLILILYIFLTAFSPSILRAVFFFLLNSINKISYLFVKPINIFLLTISLSILINPYYIFNIGFLYSFTISFFLILNLEVIKKEKRYIKKLIIISFICFFSGLPITLIINNEVNVLSIFYNLLYVPYISIVVYPLTILTLLFPVLDTLLSMFLFFLEESSLFLENNVESRLIFAQVNIIVYLLYYLILYLFFKTKKKILVIFFICVLAIHYFYPQLKNESFFVILDVGQGDSFIFHTDNKTVLVDTGGIFNFNKEEWRKKESFSIVESITIPYLKKRGIKKIDYLILTHGDYDHMGEASILAENFKVEKAYINANEINDLERKFIKIFSNTHQLKNGSQFSIGNMHFHSIGKDIGTENESSIVLYVNYKGISFLMMGDAYKNTEEYIIKTYHLEDIDILKVGHHGSKTSTSELFIKTINPKKALISAGRNNRFNHPHKEVIEILEKNEVSYLITSDNGMIYIDLKTKNKIKKETRKIWRN